MARITAIRISAIVVLAMFCGFEFYYHTGIVGMTKKPNHVFIVPGCICHDSSGNTRVWITGPETLAAGQQALYTISVMKDSNIACGFNVASFFGDLGIADSVKTQLLRPNKSDTDSLELTHTMPNLANGHDTVTWSFYYRAPLTTGIIDTLYANGNSVDTSQDPSGDGWNFADNFLVHVTGPNSVVNDPTVHAFHLLQNYPNPFNPSTRIQFELASATQVELKVFDITGRDVAELINGELSQGVHEVVFSTEKIPLASGMYCYRLRAGDFTQVRKMLLVR